MSIARVLLSTMLFTFSAAVAGQAQTLRIFHIDVDQADATLIVSPSGRTLLVDSGKNGHGARLRAIMQSAGVTQIDHFVATHYHEDHYGGVDDLTASPAVTIVNAYDRGDKAFLPASKRNSPTFRDYEAAVGGRADHLTRGETIPLDPVIIVTCISSGGVVLGEQDPLQHGSDENDMSVSLLIQFGNFRYFVGGDIETPTEAKIAARDIVQDVDVYQANHHGADNGSSQVLLDDLRPSVIVVSNGSNASFRHPRAATLRRMQGLTPSPVIFQTNKYLNSGDDGGNVSDSFIADPETNDTDGTIAITVDRAAGMYTVAFGATMHTFQTKSRAVGPIVIESLLPDPTIGPDRELEQVTLRNDGTQPIPMDGWLVRDASGRIWPLGALGTIDPGQSAIIQRNTRPMSLNNDGDTITLIDAGGQVRDSFIYTSTQPDVLLLTGH